VLVLGVVVVLMFHPFLSSCCICSSEPPQNNSGRTGRLGGEQGGMTGGVSGSWNTGAGVFPARICRESPAAWRDALRFSPPALCGTKWAAPKSKYNVLRTEGRDGAQQHAFTPNTALCKSAQAKRSGTRKARDSIVGSWSRQRPAHFIG